MAKMPDPTRHLIWSLTKSALRILSCVLGVILKSVVPIGIGLALAELFGIAEEII